MPGAELGPAKAADGQSGWLNGMAPATNATHMSIHCEAGMRTLPKIAKPRANSRVTTNAPKVIDTTPLAISR